MPSPNYGEGTTFKVNDGAANAFQVWPDLTGITPPAPAYGTVERKQLGNTTAKQKIASLPDPGTMDVTYEMSDATFARGQTLWSAAMAANKSFQVIYPDGLQLAFTGYVSMNKPNAVVAEQVSTATMTVVLTSLLTVSDTIT